MDYDVLDAQYRGGYTVWLRFRDGTVGEIDLQPELEGPVFEPLHIKRLALFGSVLREDFGPDSDIDVLVEFQPGHVPGFKFVSIERELSTLLNGRRVDMVTPKFLNARIREHVLSTAEPLYVAA